MTVEELKCRCTVREFRQWVRLFSDQPWGPAGQDVRALNVALWQLGAAGVKKVKPGDVFPWLDTGDDEVDWSMKEAAMLANARLRGLVREG